MPAQIVPVTSDPNQSFSVTLDIDQSSITLQLRVRFSEMAGYWTLAIRDASGVLLLDGIPMIAGAYPAANILGQFAYLGIGSAFVVNASGVEQDSPSASNLGTDWVLVWDDTP